MRKQSIVAAVLKPILPPTTTPTPLRKPRKPSRDWTSAIPDIKAMLDLNTPWSEIAQRYHVDMGTILREVREVYHLEKRMTTERREERERRRQELATLKNTTPNERE